jgi:hypothetical protein
MHIWTENPLKEIWHQLRYLKSPANVVNLLSGKTESRRQDKWPVSEGLKKQAYEIASCIEQSDQYFLAAGEVGLATKPLLQFYGAQALAKAVILANDSTMSLSNLKYHGLSSRPSTAKVADRQTLQTYCDDPQQWEVEEEFASVNDGVLPHLVRIAGDKVPDKGEVIRFKELVRVLPDLSAIYRRHYGEPSHCLYLYGNPKLDSNGFFTVCFSSVTREEIRTIFPEFDLDFHETSQNNNIGFRSSEPVTSPPDFAVTVESAIAGSYYVRPHSSGLFTPISVQYSAQFILSNIVRYKPAFWMSVLDGTKTGAASIVEAFCNLFERQYPSEVLAHIWQEPFSFGSPGYLA